jgi:hypothetical protein
LLHSPAAGAKYARQLREFRALQRETGHAAPIELYPQLSDATTVTPYDPHYAVQGGWVLRGLLEQRPDHHVDVASQVNYLQFFASLVPTTFVDIRPCGLSYPGLEELPGSVLRLPFADRAVSSVSSLHVVEHIGLGRYGDPLDPAGMRKALAELARVVAQGGSLYVSTPVGRSRVCFNAHRVSAASDVVDWTGLPLRSFAAVRDDGKLVEDAAFSDVSGADYALGLFRFTRE